MRIKIVVIFALSLFLVGCGTSDNTGQQAIAEENIITPTVPASTTPTDTPIPTFTMTPTDTPIPTVTMTPTDTPIPTFTMTPTDTPFPTNTPVASPTPLPEQLTELPQYGANDVVVVAGAYVFQVMDVDVLDVIGEDITPNDGNRFLLLDGLLYNYSDVSQDFFRTDFEITLPNGETILPSLNRMQQLQQNNPEYTNIEYPRREFAPLNSLTVDARRWEEIFIVYEVPESFDEITLTYNPANIDPPSTIGLWVVQDADSEEYNIYKAYDNGVALFDIDFEFTNRRVQLEELIDEELIEVDNCFGNAAISRTFTFSEEITTSYNIGGDLAATGADVVGTAAGALLGNPIVGQILTSGFTGFFNLEDSETIVVTREERLSASPGTKTRYQLSWYRVTLQGTLQLQVGGENFYIPYTITDRLRSDLDSLTPGECESSD